MGGCCETTRDRVKYFSPFHDDLNTLQVAGHRGALTFDGERVRKRCSMAELANYKMIFSEESEEDSAELKSLRQLRPFLPFFYGQTTDETGDRCIEIENLLYTAPNASFMDIKLGTSSITINAL